MISLGHNNYGNFPRKYTATCLNWVFNGGCELTPLQYLWLGKYGGSTFNGAGPLEVDFAVRRVAGHIK